MRFFQLLQKYGVSPDMTAGHSYGEYVALWAAGCLSDESLMFLSEARGRIIEDLTSSCPGSMAALNTSEEELRKVIKGKQIWIANYNSPDQLVISGSSSEINKIAEYYQGSEVKVRILPVSCAFHSPLIHPAQEQFAQVLKTTKFNLPQIPVYSNTTAAQHSIEIDKILQQLVQHLTHPVKFTREIQAMYEDGARIFIEVGPRNILTNLVKQILSDQPHISVSIDQRGRSGLVQLQHCLGQLFTQGRQVNLDQLFFNRIEQNWSTPKIQSSGPSPTTWLIRGDRIRPFYSKKIVVNVPQKPTKKIKENLPPKIPALQEPVMQEEGRRQKSFFQEKKEDHGSNTLPGSQDQIIFQFQKMMQKFLDTQKEVMLNYLQKSPSSNVTSVFKEKKEDLPSAQIEVKEQTDPGEKMPHPSEEANEAPAGDTLDKEKIKELLLTIVSERTGYPPEMLDLNLDMEADLGIDSIKRIEIMGSLQKEISNFRQDTETEKEMEKAGEVKTLQGIIDLIAKAAGSKEEEKSEKDLKNKRENKESIQEYKNDLLEKKGDIQRLTLKIEKCPLNLSQLFLDKNKVVLITEDEKNISSLLASGLKEKGYKVALVKMGDTPEEKAPGHYSTDLGSYEKINLLINTIMEKQGPIGGLIHLYPLRNNQEILELDLSQWRKLLSLNIKSLFYLAKSLEPQLKEAAKSGGSCLMAVSLMGGDFGSFQTYPAFSPLQGGCSGFIKSLQHEWPEVNCKIIDFHPEEEKEILAQNILKELHDKQGPVEVGYINEQRYILKPEIKRLSSEELKCRIDSSWIILITGGARGITADIAKKFARKYKPTLLLVGSSSFPQGVLPFDTSGSLQEVKARLINYMKNKGELITPAQVEKKYQRIMKGKEIQDNIKVLQDFGAQVNYYQVDVRDEKAFSQLIEKIYQTYGRIDGVIHGAGIIEDKLLKDKSPDSFDRVFHTKVDSAFILAKNLHPETLKFLAFFSSVAARFGNRGQGDYAAANEILNKLAIYLDKKWPARVISINWGPWENSNMVPALLQKEFEKHGVQLISRHSGPQQFDQEISYGEKGQVEVLYGGGGWENRLSGSEKKEPISEIYPLLQSIQNLQPNKDGSVEIIHELNTSKDLYLMDHQLEGKPVLPMTMGLELMVEAASLGWPGWHINRVSNLKVLNGIIVSHPTKIHIIARPTQFTSSDTLILTVEIKTTGQNARSHYRTTIEMSKNVNGQYGRQLFPLSVNKESRMSTQEAYQRWLFHGPLFQGISEIQEINSDNLQGIFVPSSPQKLLAGKPKGDWLIDPVIVDSGLQMIILWSRKYWDMMPLPSGFQHFRRFGPLSGSKIFFQSKILPTSSPGMLHADLAFFNEQGKLMAFLEDMEAACSKSLNRLADEKVDGVRR